MFALVFIILCYILYKLYCFGCILRHTGSWLIGVSREGSWDMRYHNPTVKTFSAPAHCGCFIQQVIKTMVSVWDIFTYCDTARKPFSSPLCTPQCYEETLLIHKKKKILFPYVLMILECMICRSVFIYTVLTPSLTLKSWSGIMKDTFGCWCTAVVLLSIVEAGDVVKKEKPLKSNALCGSINTS